MKRKPSNSQQTAVPKQQIVQAQMTKDQRTLLMFLETQLVDCSGRVNGQHMNAADFAQCDEWVEAGLIGFGRIASQDINNRGAHWVTFSEDAWVAAHIERRQRASRLIKERTYQTTAEKRAAVA